MEHFTTKTYGLALQQQLQTQKRSKAEPFAKSFRAHESSGLVQRKK
jgi:hypothetical protein